MDLIMAFLIIGELPVDKAEVRHVKYKVAKYDLVDDILYRKGYTLSYLRCVHPSQVNKLLYKIYEGTYKNHIRGRALSRKAPPPRVFLADHGPRLD